MPRKSKNNSIPLINALNKIYKTSESSGLVDAMFADLSLEIQSVGEQTGTKDKEAFMFAIVCSRNLFGEEVDYQDLTRFFEVTPFELVEYIKILNNLTEKGLLVRQKNRRRYSDGLRKHYYIVNQEIMNAVLNGQPIKLAKEQPIKDVMDVLEKMNDLFLECINDNLEAHELLEEIMDMMAAHTKFSLMKRIKELDLSPVECAVYFYVTWKTMNGNLSVDMDEPLNSFFQRSSGKVKFLQSIYNGENKLIKNDLLEYSNGRFLNDIDFILSDLSLTLLQENGITVLKRKSNSNSIKPEDIAEKVLFYETEEMVQMNDLKSLMVEESYVGLMERLKSKALPQNLNILLFGAPGTGKTESVYQLAKASGREIMKVEISQSKSMWFGESEKLIKKIFRDYYELSVHTKKAPILLFNEADAILSSRKSHSKSPVAQTENAMQNILLEELENFKGIFIATTNLAENLDKAFDRRFLYKIQFQRPGVKARAAIWKSKWAELSDSDAETIAKDHDLTGGQIDNIIRKIEIQEILKGEKVDLAYIQKMCTQEIILQKGMGSIGFGKG
jgi:AAA+ superfamily predicted ATPase